MFELEEGNPQFALTSDPRHTMAVPPPVRIVSVADVSLLALPGHERWLDTFFFDVLKFDPVAEGDATPRVKYAETFHAPRSPAERLPGKTVPPVGTPSTPIKPLPLVYRAENFLLRFTVAGPGEFHPEHIRVVAFEVPSLPEVSRRMLDRQISYERFRGLLPGLEYLQVQDPSGHVLQIQEGFRLPL